MKNLILVCAIAIGSVQAADLYVDAYRFDDISHTGVMGINGARFGAEISAYDGSLSLTHRSYLEFTNIEIGAEFELTNSVDSNAFDGRMLSVEGGYFLIPKPYIKVGSDLFAIISIDESNAPILKVGFNLW